MAPDEMDGDFDTGATGDTGEQFSSDPHLGAVWDNLGNDQPAHEPTQRHDGAEPPISWAAEERQRWGTLPPETQAYIARREREAAAQISQLGQERAQIRRLAEQAGLPAEMPVQEMVQHLQTRFGPGHDAAETMRQMAETYQREYEPLRDQLNQFVDVIGDKPPHEFVSELLARERALRSNNPAAIQQLAEAYGFTPSQAEHVNKLQAELAEYQDREGRRTFEEFAKDKPFLRDEQMQSALIVEMKAILREAPGLRGEKLLRLAADALAEKTGIARQQEQQQQQQMRQWMQQAIAERDQAWAKQQAERDAQRQKEMEEKTRWAKKAVRVNLKGSPGHNSNRGTFANVDSTLREIWNRNNS